MRTYSGRCARGRRVRTCVGLIIGIIVIAMYLPMFKVFELVQ